MSVCDAPTGGNRAALNGPPTRRHLINTNSGFEIEVVNSPITTQLFGGAEGSVAPAVTPNAY